MAHSGEQHEELDNNCFRFLLRSQDISFYSFKYFRYQNSIRCCISVLKYQFKYFVIVIYDYNVFFWPVIDVLEKPI